MYIKVFRLWITSHDGAVVEAEEEEEWAHFTGKNEGERNDADKCAKRQKTLVLTRGKRFAALL